MHINMDKSYISKMFIKETKHYFLSCLRYKRPVNLLYLPHIFSFNSYNMGKIPMIQAFDGA